MKIAICGSMTFASQMIVARDQLEKNGHTCFIPEDAQMWAEGQHIVEGGYSEGARRKIEHNFIKGHYDLIEKSDAILVLNYDKRGIKNYIGGNSFLEIGFAHILGKKIFFMQDIPDIELMREELEAVQPVILDNNLWRIV